MSSDTSPDASEIPTLPPPDRAWHVPDAATSVFDDPVPPSALPTLPTLPTLPPAVPPAPVSPIASGSVAPNPAAGPGPIGYGYGYGEVPGGMAAVHRASLQNRKRRTPLLHRIVRAVVVLALIAGVVGAGYFVVQGVRDANRLPAFDTERPVYGTVVIAYEETVEGVTSTGTVTAGGDPAVFEIRSDPGSAEPIHLVSDGTTFYGELDGQWTSFVPTPEYLAAIESAGTLPMFVDYVPAAIRRYASVADKRDVEIDGVEMERIELHIDDDAFEAADPVASAAWETFVGMQETEGTSGVRLVITVDDLGIAWRVESWSDIDSDRSAYRLVSYSDDVFVPVLPTAGTPVAAAPSPADTTTDPLAGASATTVACWDELWCGGAGTPTLPPPPAPVVSVPGPSIPTATPVPAAGG